MLQSGRIHRARILDIAVGMGLSSDKITNVFKARSDVTKLKNSLKNFREDFVDATTPSLLAVDLDRDILSKITTGYSEIPLSTSDIDKLRSDILSGISKTSAEITTSKLQTLFDTEIAALDAGLLRLSNRETSKYSDYTLLFNRFGSNISSKLYSRTVLRLTDPESIMTTGPNTIVLLGKTFFALRDNCINAAINSALSKHNETSLLEKKLFYKDKPLRVGDFAVIGHTVASVGSGSRINTPLLYDRFLRLEASGKPVNFAKIEEEFLTNVKIFQENKVVFKQNFSTTASNLFELGLSVTVYMDPGQNSTSGRTDELQAIKKAVENQVKSEILPDLATSILTRFKYIGTQQLQKTHGSPTIVEHIEALVVNAIKGKKTKPAVHSSTKVGKTSTTVPIIRPKSGLKVKLIKSGKTGTTVSTKPKPNVEDSMYKLQKLLDAILVQKIKDNMQTEKEYELGSRKLLTNRTGRFAESVKVERISKSRAGMITAFYSYMKNPYATFSPGGRQASPKTRDPKLLIAKSIREVAQELAYNNLRSVNV